jgi:endonuclease-3
MLITAPTLPARLRYPQAVAGPRTPRGRAKVILPRLADEYPGTAADLCELTFASPWQLLVATVLSAQTTDTRVNLVTPVLFARYPEPEDLAAASLADVEEIIYPTGFFRAKSRSIVGLANAVTERFHSEVPTAMADLVSLPGVGRKTANVVRSVALGLPGFPVDTHVSRLTGRLGLTTETDPVRIETDVCAFVPKDDWGSLSLRLILHGRRVCVARKPRCGDCLLADVCPSAGKIATVRPATAQDKAPARRRKEGP